MQLHNDQEQKLTATNNDDVLVRLQESRALSQVLTKHLSDEDMVVQAIDDASPTKWHLAHTTWFYESFILQAYLADYKLFSDDFSYCFNSYYEAKGDRHPRPQRGLLTRPSSEEVIDYRDHVDNALSQLFDSAVMSDGDTADHILRLLEVGINHEQQHQELMLTDILALFARQPLRPAYEPMTLRSISNAKAPALDWRSYPSGVCEIGHAGPEFSYDNEGPRHHVLIHPFKFATRCITNAEWIAFIEDGGYSQPLLWLSEGWEVVQRRTWRAPEYWEEKYGHWHQMTLNGLLPVEDSAPVSHISYYEADAFARWAGKRLPTEFEWEVASTGCREDETTNTLGTQRLRPSPAATTARDTPHQMIGDVWEWTSSAYQAYPGYRIAEGALGEYNGKFMCSQYVLRGGSCVTPDGHIRTTYRNFFYPYQRWQFMGLRLADNA